MKKNALLIVLGVVIALLLWWAWYLNKKQNGIIKKQNQGMQDQSAEVSRNVWDAYRHIVDTKMSQRPTVTTTVQA